MQNRRVEQPAAGGLGAYLRLAVKPGSLPSRVLQSAVSFVSFHNSYPSRGGAGLCFVAKQ